MYEIAMYFQNKKIKQISFLAKLFKIFRRRCFLEIQSGEPKFILAKSTFLMMTAYNRFNLSRIKISDITSPDHLFN